jgi:hypothetical protein
VVGNQANYFEVHGQNCCFFVLASISLLGVLSKIAREISVSRSPIVTPVRPRMLSYQTETRQLATGPLTASASPSMKRQWKTDIKATATTTKMIRGWEVLLVLCLASVLRVAAADALRVAAADALRVAAAEDFFTVTGTGGVSPAQAGVSTTPFLWIDTTGRTPGADATAYGFAPFPAFQQALDLRVGGGAGSLLLSSPFRLRDGDVLTVNFLLISQRLTSSGWWADGSPPEGFALLLKDGVAVAVLENLTAAGDRYYSNVLTPGIPPADCNFTPPSPGVTSRTTEGSGLDVTLGSTHYYADGGPPMCGCFVGVSTKFMPGAGTYQLLFGLYDFLEDYQGFRAALAIKSVTAARR